MALTPEQFSELSPTGATPARVAMAVSAAVAEVARFHGPEWAPGQRVRYTWRISRLEPESVVGWLHAPASVESVTEGGEDAAYDWQFTHLYPRYGYWRDDVVAVATAADHAARRLQMEHDLALLELGFTGVGATAMGGVSVAQPDRAKERARILSGLPRLVVPVLLPVLAEAA